MTRVAVMLAEGFEEIEALTPVDVLRRAGIACDMVGLTGKHITGSHGILVSADIVFDGELSDYDMIILPGGMPGATNLRDNDQLIHQLQMHAQAGKWLAAICAAPIVLEKAGVLEGKRYTCFPGQEVAIANGIHQTDIVVVDGNIVTSRGAGTALAFAYQLVDLLGGNGQQLAQSMIYNELFQ